jgi:tetratricopeptide (TPR) repeat protein
VLSVLLLAFPVGFIAYYIIKYVKKTSSIIQKKVEEIKELDKMRTSILEESITEGSEQEAFLSDTTETVSEDASYPQESSVLLLEIEEDVMVSEDALETHPVTVEIADKQRKLLEKLKYEALVAKEKGKLEEYEKKLIEWLAIDENNLDLHKLLADLYFTLGQHKKSLSLLKKIIELDPQDHKAIWQIGELYLSNGEFETAELLVEKAISMKPSNPKYHISLVEVYYNTNRKNDAIQTLEKVLKLRPASVPYLLALADLYSEIGDQESAQKYYFRVLEYEPSNVKAKQKLQNVAL